MKRFFVLIVATMFLAPFATRAQLGFGGLINFVVPCTCSGGSAVYYTPLYISSPVPTTGALYYAPGSILYSYYNPITPGIWNLGKFSPGTGMCMITVPGGCAAIPTYGTILFEGTSGLPRF